MLIPAHQQRHKDAPTRHVPTTTLAPNARSAQSVRRYTIAQQWSTKWPNAVTTVINRYFAAAVKKCLTSVVRVVRLRRIKCAASHWCKDTFIAGSVRIRSWRVLVSSVSMTKLNREKLKSFCFSDINTGAFAYPCAGSVIARRVILTAAHCALAKAEGHRL